MLRTLVRAASLFRSSSFLSSVFANDLCCKIPDLIAGLHASVSWMSALSCCNNFAFRITSANRCFNLSARSILSTSGHCKTSINGRSELSLPSHNRRKQCLPWLFGSSFPCNRGHCMGTFPATIIIPAPSSRVSPQAVEFSVTWTQSLPESRHETRKKRRTNLGRSSSMMKTVKDQEQERARASLGRFSGLVQILSRNKIIKKRINSN